ncbi:MAG: VWA domain-containing protein [Kiritimatiellae bacterium]|nr:VWA domain-containing protein [Kiritimatiellia bacterium]
MRFAYPWMLLLMALVPVAGAAWHVMRKRAAKRLAKLNTSVAASSAGGGGWQEFLALTGLALALFAAARPQWGRSNQKLEAASRNVVVAIDVSRSMLAEDLHPNRLDRAKADVADLIDSLQQDRCAIVAFRRTGELVCPLTTDHAFLHQALEGLSPESAAKGETDIGAAIRASLADLDPAEDDHNAIILISDGGDLRDGAVEAARIAKKRGVRVFTVGLGDPTKESTIPDASGAGVQKYKDAAVKTKLDEASLAAVAKESGGRYVPLAMAGTAETTLGAIYRRFLRQVAAKEQSAEEELRATERYGLFLVPGILCLAGAGALSRGRFASRGRKRA